MRNRIIFIVALLVAGMALAQNRPNLRKKQSRRQFRKPENLLFPRFMTRKKRLLIREMTQNLCLKTERVTNDKHPHGQAKAH